MMCFLFAKLFDKRMIWFSAFILLTYSSKHIISFRKKKGFENHMIQCFWHDVLVFVLCSDMLFISAPIFCQKEMSSLTIKRNVVILFNNHTLQISSFEYWKTKKNTHEENKNEKVMFFIFLPQFFSWPHQYVTRAK